MWALGSTPSSFHFRWTSSGNICGEEESLGVCEPLMFRYLKSYSRAFTVISKSRQNFRTSHFNMFEFGDLNKKVLAQTGRHSRRGWIKGNHQMLCEEQRCNLKLKIEKLKFSTSSINNNPILLLKFSINKIPIAVPGSVKLSIRYVYMMWRQHCTEWLRYKIRSWKNAKFGSYRHFIAVQ